MYNNLALINKTKHKNLKVSAIENFSFANNLKFIPAVYSEATLLGADYPLVITIEETPSLGILVALDEGNLSITPEGKWYGAYPPAYIRKYPFALGVSKEQGKSALMMIDMDSSLVSTESGALLFNEDGTQSSMFQEKIKLVTTYVKEQQITAEMIKILLDADILERGEIVVGEGEERKVLVKGFQAVSKPKLDALSSEVTKDWEAMGINQFVEAHLKSLDNIDKLFKLASQQQK